MSDVGCASAAGEQSKLWVVRANDAIRPCWGVVLSWESRSNRRERNGPMDRVRRATPGVFRERARRIAGDACDWVGPVCVGRLW